MLRTHTSKQAAGTPARRLACALLATATALSAVTTPAQADTDPTPAPPHDCAQADERCDGTLQVPLNWKDPGSGTITVAFTWVPRGDRARPPLTTVIANGGGPGPLDPSYGELAKAMLGPLADRVDVLMVEPRGFGRSAPLTCDGLDIDRPATIAACTRRLGSRASYFTTEQHAADIEAVRKALGGRNVTFVGNSYGTLIGQAYAARFPKQVRAMFLNSVVAADARGYEARGFRNQHQMGMNALIAACRRSAACARAHPHPERLWERLLRRLRSAPDRQVPVRATEPLLIAASVPDARENLAAASAYLRGDRAPLRRLVKRATPTPSPAALPPALFTYYCGDARAPYDRTATARVRARQLDAYLARHPIFAPYTAREASGPTAQWLRACTYWPTPRHTPPVPPGTRLPDVPVLAMSGRFDTETAPEDATAVAARFPRGRALNIPFGGHGLLMGTGPDSGCVQDLLRTFVAEPSKPVAGCSAEHYRLLGEHPRRSADLPPIRGGDDLPGAARRTIAAAFATAVDALAPRGPYSTTPLPAREPGLRGGHVRYDAKTSTVTLAHTRYVKDVQVSGTVRYAPDTGVATADLKAKPTGSPETPLTLSWRPFQPEDLTRLQGKLNGHPFQATAPAF
ncbi:hypothetical protein DP939_37570 [Spongiactinospora rosea]|uniref:AB hydrolase-1 domain-containing protein n=1 Tax=Spongiactinospora rosea TaxID=2248750 RepID=A0A366LPA2_9ACTN|nr:alpha/beta fold hydrolase [Spongiactinospora rosea]RBQ15114.1 hypothetical protein DP939_37570 [Spongiactinospora rosea]